MCDKISSNWISVFPKLNKALITSIHTTKALFSENYKARGALVETHIMTAQVQAWSYKLYNDPEKAGYLQLPT